MYRKPYSIYLRGTISLGQVLELLGGFLCPGFKLWKLKDLKPTWTPKAGKTLGLRVRGSGFRA